MQFQCPSLRNYCCPAMGPRALPICPVILDIRWLALLSANNGTIGRARLGSPRHLQQSLYCRLHLVRMNIRVPRPVRRGCG